MGTDDQAIHRVAAQHVEEGELGVLFLSRRADHRFVATVVERNLDLVQQGRKEGMSDVWDDDADEVRAVEREIAPDLARDVVECLDGGLDFCSRGGGDVFLIVEHERNRAGADASELGDIFDSCHGERSFHLFLCLVYHNLSVIAYLVVMKKYFQINKMTVTRKINTIK